MKKLTLMAFAVCIVLGVQAQSPDLFSYQAVVRDNSGKVIASKAVSLRFSINKTTATGTAQYVETHNPTTDANGLVSLMIGGGTVSSGIFSAIDWATDKYFLQVELDPAGGSSYSNMGTTQLISVPYAKHATTSSRALDNFDRDSTNELQALSKSGDTIFLSNGGFVQVPKNWDNDSTNELQAISKSGDTILLSNGGFVRLPSNLDNDSSNEIQQLTISNDTIFLSNGGFVEIPDSSLLGVPKGGSGVGAGGTAKLKDFDNKFSAVKNIGFGFEIVGIKSDNSKNLYVLGTFEQTMKLGSTTINVTSGKGLGVVLIKLDSNLNIQWHKYSTSGNSRATPRGFVTDASGNSYFVVKLERNTGNLTWDGNTYSVTHSQSQGVVMKINSSGAVAWTVPYRASNGTHHMFLAINSTSDVYFTGNLVGSTFTLGSVTTSYSSSYQVNYGLYKISSSGINIQLLDSASELGGNFVLVDSKDNIIVATSYRLSSRSSNQLRLKSGTYTMTRNGMILKYSPSGTLLRRSNSIDLRNGIDEDPHNFLIENNGKYFCAAIASGTWVGNDFYPRINAYIAELDTGLTLQKSTMIKTPNSSLLLGLDATPNTIKLGIKVHGSYLVNDISYKTLSGIGQEASGIISVNNSLQISNHQQLQSFNSAIGFLVSCSGSTTFLGSEVSGNFYNKGIKYTPGVYLFKE